MAKDKLLSKGKIESAFKMFDSVKYHFNITGRKWLY